MGVSTNKNSVIPLDNEVDGYPPTPDYRKYEREVKAERAAAMPGSASPQAAKSERQPAVPARR